MADVVNTINKKYVYISNRLTGAYTKTFGLPCDLYFPIFDPYNDTTKYRDMKIFTPHQSPTYSKKPDVYKTLFYIPYLIKDQSMNSSETEFDSFYTDNEPDRPFIETTKKRELPIATKVVVYQGSSIMKFFVDKKLVVTGADGFMILRMYLAPLAKDNDEDEVEQEETKIEGTDYSPKPADNLGTTLGSSLTRSATEEETTTQQEEKPKKKRTYTRRKKKAETIVEPAIASADSNLTMQIPDED